LCGQGPEIGAVQSCIKATDKCRNRDEKRDEYVAVIAYWAFASHNGDLLTAISLSMRDLRSKVQRLLACLVLRRVTGDDEGDDLGAATIVLQKSVRIKPPNAM